MPRKRYARPQPIAVEIIPWLHELGSKAHEVSINYLENLPKNSVVAVEWSAREQAKAQKILDEIQAKRDPDSFFKLESHSMALLDALHTSQARNFLLKPVRSRTGELAIKKYVRELVPPVTVGKVVKQELASIRLEEGFSSGIAAIAGSKKKPLKITALVGVGHVAGLARLLQERGIKAIIKTSLFDANTRSQFEEFIAGSEIQRRALERQAYQPFLQQYAVLAQMLKPLQAPNELATAKAGLDVWSKICKANDSRIARIARKAALKKTFGS